MDDASQNKHIQVGDVQATLFDMKLTNVVRLVVMKGRRRVGPTEAVESHELLPHFFQIDQLVRSFAGAVARRISDSDSGTCAPSVKPRSGLLAIVRR